MQRLKYGKRGSDPKVQDYFDGLDNQRLKSQVLNAGNKMPGLYTPIWDRTNIKTRIWELTGDADGFVKSENDEGTLAVIPAAKQVLTQIEAKFTRLQKDRKKQGYEVTEEWPENLLHERLLAESKLDVLEEELIQLNKWLADIPLPKEEEEEPIMPFGLICSSHLWGRHRTQNVELQGQLYDIDGQRVDYIGDVLSIIDERSKYNGMSVADYRRLAQEWRENRIQKDQKTLELKKQQCRELGLPLPKTYMRPRTRVAYDSLPVWPKWAQNQYQVQKELETQNK